MLNGTTGPQCGSADFNCDGSIATDADIDAFFGGRRHHLISLAPTALPLNLPDMLTARGYERASFADVFTRYAPSTALPPVTPVTSAQPSRSEPFSTRYPEPPGNGHRRYSSVLRLMAVGRRTELSLPTIRSVLVGDAPRSQGTRTALWSATRSLWRWPDAVPNRVICAQPYA